MERKYKLIKNNNLDVPENIQKEMLKLIDDLTRWNYEYYQLQQPTVDDATYDKTNRRLIELEEEFDCYFEHSTTQMVGSDLEKNSTFEKVKHERPVLSLANAFNLEELKKYESDVMKITGNRISFIVEPKLDGSHIVLTYDNGKLIRGVTRGNGSIGEDITENVKHVNGIPKQIDFKGHLVVDGEILIKNSDFEKINNSLPEDERYANSRNLAAGSLKQKDSSKIKQRHLTAFLYEVFSPDKDFNTQQEVLEFLKQNKFNVDNFITKKFNSIESAWSYLEEMDREKANIDIPLDGMVFKLNERNYYDEIGMTAKVPKFNIAYKFPPVIKQTKVLNIYPTVGRTGKITYVADLQPVEIEGVIVKSVTLHNYDYIIDKDIKIGDTVELYRSGMVIPKINKVIKDKRTGKEKEYPRQSVCPACGGVVAKNNEADVDDFCQNEACSSRTINKIIHFCARDAMNIEGVSQKTIEKFYEAGFLNNVFDLYQLKNYKEQILKGDFGFANKSWNNMISAIEKSKENSLERLLFALGIPGVGKTMAKKIAKKYQTLEDLANADIKDLQETEDVGEVVANDIVSYFDNNVELFSILNSLKINTNFISNGDYTIDKTNPLFNKKFCITGSFDEYNRDELKELLENRFGAVPVSSVSKNTDFLIAGANAGSKLDKANELNIKIINENELNNLISNKIKKNKIYYGGY